METVHLFPVTKLCNQGDINPSLFARDWLSVFFHEKTLSEVMKIEEPVFMSHACLIIRRPLWEDDKKTWLTSRTTVSIMAEIHHRKVFIS